VFVGGGGGVAVSGCGVLEGGTSVWVIVGKIVGALVGGNSLGVLLGGG
jgi:hypothetical protein